ncbi:hypothetical protein SO802_029928 [Lithocarpus litseifolius]|uniref:Uncharacterized protein n=1 Tax=Lithocarpus litseifolius TaxID=425828 RepID=A0AAW2BY13_9ROSI
MSNEVGLGRLSNWWQDGSRVGRGGVGVAVSHLGMRRQQLIGMGLQSVTLPDELGKSSNRWQDGSRVGHGSVGVVVSRLGMRRQQLTGTSLQYATLRDGWRCGQ